MAAILNILNCRLLLRGVILGAGLGMAACGGGKLPSAGEVAAVIADDGEAGIEARLFAEINRYRVRQSKGALRRHPGLDQLARHHSQRMLREGNLSHDDYHHRLGMAESYLKVEALRENVFFARGVAEEALPARTVQGWVDSKAHRMNLLANTHFCGIGVAMDGEGRFYATQLAGKPGEARSSYQAGMPKSYSNVYGVGTGGMDW